MIEEVFRHRTHFLYAERARRIEGVLPLAHVKSLLFGNALVVAAVRRLRRRGRRRRRGGDGARGRGAGAGASGSASITSNCATSRARHPDWPTQDLYVTFRKEILPDVEANMLAIPRKQRAMVRKGIKNGLRERDRRGAGPLLRALCRQRAPARHAGAAEALLRGAAARVRRGLRGADRRRRRRPAAVSSVLSFYFRDEVLPYYAGDDVAARDLAANDFKYWELMRRACERGLKVFDYGRSKQGTGSYAFKKNWGFEPQPLHYEYRLYRGDAIPQNNPLNPKYRALIALWRRLPLPVANLLGPHLARSLG